MPRRSKTRLTLLVGNEREMRCDGYPLLIHRLTRRRSNHANLHIRGSTDEGTIVTPLDITVLNRLDSFHLAHEGTERIHAAGCGETERIHTAGCGETEDAVRLMVQDKLVKHMRYIEISGREIPQAREWKRGKA